MARHAPGGPSKSAPGPRRRRRPAVRSSAIWSRLARMMADCSAARRPASRRIRRTDGPVARERESRPPKSVSADIKTRPSTRARCRTAGSGCCREDLVGRHPGDHRHHGCDGETVADVHGMIHEPIPGTADRETMPHDKALQGQRALPGRARDKKCLVGVRGLEPRTSSLSGKRSNRLSYTPKGAPREASAPAAATALLYRIPSTTRTVPRETASRAWNVSPGHRSAV